MIRQLDAAAMQAALPDLAEILRDCVAGGASVNFLLPYSAEDAAQFWHKAIMAATRQELICFGAFEATGQLSGVVLLGLDTPPNQQHRGEVRKMLVHRRARRQGLARALMLALEAEAARLGRRLLVLDTNQGSDAEPLYQSLGYTCFGVVPGYSIPPDGSAPTACAFYYKFLP